MPRIVEFSDASWGRRAIRSFVTLRPVAALSGAVLPAFDGFVLRRSRGRFTASGWLTGLPIVEIETRGAVTGETRRTPVMAVPFGGDVVVLGANFGRSRDPAWCANLRADPELVVHDQRRSSRAHAAELYGTPRDEAFRAALRLNPGWRRFRKRAAGRPVPVFRLTSRP